MEKIFGYDTKISIQVVMTKEIISSYVLVTTGYNNFTYSLHNPLPESSKGIYVFIYLAKERLYLDIASQISVPCKAYCTCQESSFL